MRNGKDNKSAFDVRTLATLGMLTALAYGVMAACKLIPSVGGFLDLDLKDAVMAIAGYLFGPLAAFLMAVAVPFIEFVTISGTGWYGLLMNVIATSLFVIPAVCLYHRRRGTSGAVIGLTVGTLCLTVGMIAWNYVITPLYFKMPRAAVLDMMPMIVCFNLVKGVLNSAAIMLLYPPVSAALRRAGLAAPSRTLEAGERRKFNYAPVAVSLFVLAGAVLAVLAMLEII